MKVAIFDTKSYDKEQFEGYQNMEGMQFTFFETKLTPKTVGLANGFDAVCIFVNDIVDKYVIDELKSYNVGLIALRCSGYNNVDVSYARGRVQVARVPKYSPHAIAEFAMGMLLTSIRRIHKAYIRTRDYNFSLEGLIGFDLFGKTVGVVGTGNIGRAFIKIAQGFDMDVIAYDKYPSKGIGIEYVELNELWARSDIISLHCPLNDDTYHMINERSIKRMKKGVAIINTSRGALIDSEALLEGIKNRHIGTVCLDVYEEESDVFYENQSGHIMNDEILAGLISMPNVIVTSHQAFLTQEALESIAATTIYNLEQYQNGETLKYSV